MPTPQQYLDATIKVGLENGLKGDSLIQFIANLQHETGGFTRFKESTSYRAERLLEIFGPKRLKDGTMSKGRNGLNSLSMAKAICLKGSAAIAEHIYGGDWGKKNLGNLFPGDGAKYIGRGPIQITGRSNYTTYSNILGVDLVNNPDLALDPVIGARIAVDFWKRKGCDTAAGLKDFIKARKLVNGGTLGYDEIQHYATTKSEYISNSELEYRLAQRLDSKQEDKNEEAV